MSKDAMYNFRHFSGSYTEFNVNMNILAELLGEDLEGEDFEE